MYIENEDEITKKVANELIKEKENKILQIEKQKTDLIEKTIRLKIEDRVAYGTTGSSPSFEENTKEILELGKQFDQLEKDISLTKREIKILEQIEQY
ncbi:MAG: hypothetical protein ABF633_02920 [Clostridium sp.]|uniref:hypothetical protein n=1 Tax=Clostridium sp. TaxID=1506 RepID=UPI0039EA395B